MTTDQKRQLKNGSEGDDPAAGATATDAYARPQSQRLRASALPPAGILSLAMLILAAAFTVNTDTGAMLFLHDIRVIDEPLKNSAGSFSGSVRLQAGIHCGCYTVTPQANCDLS